METLNQCPKCKSYKIETLEVYNLETTDMNTKAKLKCRDCNYKWEGLVGSPYYYRQRKLGYIE